ncbi:hypothetical protein [Pseudofrankia sp. DC12]|nr:hypothetical protein [Pseudofrankia sp. DC12]
MPELAALLASHGFTVTRDESLLAISERLGLTGTRRASVTNARLAVADR